MSFIKILSFISIILIILFCFLSSNTNPITYNKDITLKFIPKPYYLQHKIGNKEEILNLSKNFSFPFILKPNRCSTCGNNVHKINNFSELQNIVKSYPHDYLMIQELAKQELEGAILYERWPNIKKGKIISIIQKEPKSKGNVALNLQTSKIKDISFLNNSKLEKIINKISNKIPGFYIGRYDIKFRSREDLKAGNFKILELNSGFGIDSSLYTNSTKHITFKKIPGQLRWFSKRVIVGLINLANPKNNILETIKNKIKEISNIYQCVKLRNKIYKWIIISLFIYLLIDLY